MCKEPITIFTDFFYWVFIIICFFIFHQSIQPSFLLLAARNRSARRSARLELAVAGVAVEGVAVEGVAVESVAVDGVVVESIAFLLVCWAVSGAWTGGCDLVGRGVSW